MLSAQRPTSACKLPRVEHAANNWQSLAGSFSTSGHRKAFNSRATIAGYYSAQTRIRPTIMTIQLATGQRSNKTHDQICATRPEHA
jgi:hypothetical protein